MEHKMAFRQKNNVLPNTRNPQRQPEVGVAFPESKDIANRSTGRQIDADKSYCTTFFVPSSYRDLAYI